jgi:DNA-directed RNA polymerase specialized sigma24 family protein/CheY-like chemotaxis protein
MSLAEKIEPHIPYLRRYARALTGSQDGGDRYVEATLEALVADAAVMPVGADTRTALLTLLTRIWNSVEVNQRGADVYDASTHSIAIDRRLAQLTPLPRQAFLLVHAEDLSHKQAAAVLEVSEAEVASLLDAASQQMADQMSTNVLIIEDEPLIAVDIQDIALSLGHTVSGIARTKDEAIKLASEETPGLVLADIQLADGSSGIDAVNELLVGFEAPVVFITAYPERLLTGTKPEPTFLMTKPFQPEALKAVICQALFFERNATLKAAS